MRLDTIWKNWNLGIILLVLFLFSWLLQGYTQWFNFVSEQESHGQSVLINDFLFAFGASTFENWQSEFLQLFTMVVLTSFLVFKGSSESKDSTEKMQRDILEIKRILKKK